MPVKKVEKKGLKASDLISDLFNKLFSNNKNFFINTNIIILV